MKLDDVVILNELIYNKPMDIDKIMNILDDVTINQPKLMPQVEHILTTNGITSKRPSEIDKHLYSLDETTVHKILRLLGKING